MRVRTVALRTLLVLKPDATETIRGRGGARNHVLDIDD